MTFLGHRAARGLVLALIALFFVPLLLRGHVLLVDDYGAAQQLDELPDPAQGGLRKFLDHSSVYVPALHHQLHGDSAGWIATWDPHVELGRPVWHVSGFSKAFVLTHVLSFFVDDAFVLYTLLAVLAVLLTGFFGYQLLHSMELSPAACAFGALGLALGFYSAFWLTYAMYLWGVCWTLCLLWLIPRAIRGGGPGTALGIAFGVHALLLTAYPQQIVWHGYLVGLVVVRELLVTVDSSGERLRAVLRLALPALLGVISVAPVYADLLETSLRSSRLETEAEFFLQSLPALESLPDLALFCATLFDAHWFGNPLDSDHPLFTRGVGWTPVFCLLFALAMMRPGGRNWPWVAFLAMTLLATVWTPFYRFGIEYLGLSLSRHAPLAGAHIPVSVLAAVAADRCLGHPGRGRALDLALAGLLVLLALAAGLGAGRPLDPSAVGAGAVFALGTLAFLWRPDPRWLVVLAAASVLCYASRLAVTRPLELTRKEPDLVTQVRELTADGSRYAWLGRQFYGALHPNQESLHGLHSIHSNNSLSSEAYQDWVAQLHERGAWTEGRLFPRLLQEVEFRGEVMSYAGVGLLISTEPLDQLATLRSRIGLLGLYEPRWPRELEAQIVDFRRGQDARVRVQGPLGRARKLPVTRALDRGDRLTFELTPHPAETLLFISQQHHPDWSARSGDGVLETLVVNRLYQGVLVPPGVSEVQLEFRPLVRWSWIPQVLFAALLVGCALGRKR